MPGLLLALAALMHLPEPIARRLPPVEQCDGNAGFRRFRNDLRAVVERQDERALLAMLADDVEVNFGGDRGPALFAANWKFGERRESHVWAELRQALALGCAPTGDALIAPSFTPGFPEALDPFETVIIVPGTLLRGGRSAAAHALGKLDWHLARVTDDGDGLWLAVELVDGRKGFVRRGQTVSPLDYRLVFEHRGGKWRITAFVAGD